MTRPMPVLVTAVGGDLGQAVIKALRLGRLPWALHGCDLAADGYGAAFAASYEAVPAANAPDYAERLLAICRRKGIEAVVPASEEEIAALGPRVGGIPVISQPAAWRSVFGDKLLSMQALQGYVPLAPFADGADANAVEALIREAGFPLVVKARRSSGSRAVHIAADAAALQAALAQVEAPIVQAHLEEGDGEFSVGVFRTRTFETAIVFRRQLRHGVSWEAACVEAPEVRAYALAIARAAAAHGSLNVQLRLTADGPRLIEINPRFSSLVAARAACGFHDAEWALTDALGRETALPQEPYRPLRFRRFFHEVIDQGEGYGMIPAWEPRPLPAAALMTGAP